MWLTNLVLSLLGGAGSAIAVSVFLSKRLLKLWADRMLQTEKAKFAKELEELKAKYAQELEQQKDALARSKSVLQAEIDRSVFVSRTHFETELEAYKQAFKALAEVRLCMASVRPMIDIGPAEQPEPERKKRLVERLKELTDAYNLAISVVENQNPFYPKEVYPALQQCLAAARLEIFNVRTAGFETFSPNWYMQGEERMGEFMSAYSKVCDMVRDRISTLQVIPRS
jgi:anion-transporting  ArsA/GET3 family ATPase